MRKPFSPSKFSESLVEIPTDLLESEEIRLMKVGLAGGSTFNKKTKLELVRAEIRTRIKKGALKTITVSDEFVDICTNWHNGISSMMYAVSSTGNIKLGTNRPKSKESDRPMLDQEWHIHLWKKLRQEFRQTINANGMPNNVDQCKELLELMIAKEFCDSIVTDLEASYNVEELLESK